MKFNISLPANGTQKTIDIDDEKAIRAFLDKRISQEVEGDALGSQFAGFVFRIAGGFDKQGFPMKQGVLVNHRVRLLLKKGNSCFRERRTGERKRKSVRGCITGPDLAVINLVIVKNGSQDIPGLTDRYLPSRLGPKRANRIRKLFNLDKKDDVRKYVIRREIPSKKPGGKPHFKAPKIQRLITPLVLQHKRQRIALKKKRYTKSKQEAQEYAKLLAQRRSEAISEILSRKKSSRLSVRESEKKEEKKVDTKTTAAPAKTDKKTTTAKVETKKVETKPAATKPVEKKAVEKKAEAPKTTAPAKTEAPKTEAKKPAAKKPIKK